MIDPNEPRRALQNATDQGGKLHGPMPHRGDRGGRAWVWIGLAVGLGLLVWLVWMTVG